jgi:hypothetical protein
MIAALVGILCGNAVTWIVAIVIVLIGGPADEALGDEEESKLSDAQRFFFNASLYATLPLLVLITLAMLHQVALAYQTGLAAGLPRLLPDLLSDWNLGGATNVSGAVFLVGYCYAVFGATVGHELTHKTGVTPAFLSARGLFAFTFNTSFTTFHVHGHHRQVATFRDPATARRGNTSWPSSCAQSSASSWTRWCSRRRGPAGSASRLMVCAIASSAGSFTPSLSLSSPRFSRACRA